MYKRFTLRLVEALNDFLESEAKKHGMSKHGLILKILWDYKGGVKNGR
jgi:hypothetical protein